MGNPFKPENLYYASVPEDHALDNEARDNPTKGPRPWIILYCRQHKNSGVVLAAPLYSKGNKALISHVPYAAEQFDDLPGSSPGIFTTGYIKLEQLRALDKARLKKDAGPLACMKRQPFKTLIMTLMGMLEPHLLPP